MSDDRPRTRRPALLISTLALGALAVPPIFMWSAPAAQAGTLASQPPIHMTGVAPVHMTGVPPVHMT